MAALPWKNGLTPSTPCHQHGCEVYICMIEPIPQIGSQLTRPAKLTQKSFLAQSRHKTTNQTFS